MHNIHVSLYKSFRHENREHSPPLPRPFPQPPPRNPLSSTLFLHRQTMTLFDSRVALFSATFPLRMTMLPADVFHRLIQCFDRVLFHVISYQHCNEMHALIEKAFIDNTNMTFWEKWQHKREDDRWKSRKWRWWYKNLRMELRKQASTINIYFKSVLRLLSLRQKENHKDSEHCFFIFF